MINLDKIRNNNFREAVIKAYSRIWRKSPPYIRPRLVKLSDGSEKWGLLRSAEELKNAEGWRKKIGMFPPIYAQRIGKKKLRADLKIKRDNNERGWFIKAGKLCKRDF